MTFDHKEARALVERLDALAAKATPMGLGTAEIVQDEGYFECAMCNGSGATWGNGYLNIDGIALNVQFSGIGSEFKDNERFVMALIEAYRSGAIAAALDEIERLRNALEACWSNSQGLSSETFRFHTSLIGSIARAAMNGQTNE